jgi:hypothetical protein
VTSIEDVDFYEGSEMGDAMNGAGPPFVEQEIRPTRWDLAAMLDKPRMFFRPYRHAQIFIGVRVGGPGSQRPAQEEAHDTGVGYEALMRNGQQLIASVDQ